MRNHELQEGKEHHQTAYAAKADKGHPSSTLPATAFLRWGRGGLRCARDYSYLVQHAASKKLALIQREIHLHGRLNFDRLTVQQVGLVLPLFHGFDRGWSQYRVAAY